MIINIQSRLSWVKQAFLVHWSMMPAKAKHSQAIYKLLGGVMFPPEQLSFSPNALSLYLLRPLIATSQYSRMPYASLRVKKNNNNPSQSHEVGKTNLKGQETR